MSLFTPEQIAELATTFDLKPQQTLPVRDGRVSANTLVWWLSEEGPVEERACMSWDNIKKFPQLYQLKKPKYIVSYDRD